MSVLTLQDYENYTGNTYSGAEKNRIELIIAAVNDWVESYTGRIFGESKTFTKRIDYDPVIFLPHMDIQAISSLKINGVEMTNYKWESSGRIVLSLSGKSYSGNRRDYGRVEVTYASQYAGDPSVIPAMVKLAAMQLVSDNENKEGTQEITQASTGGYSVSTGSGSGGGSGGSQGGSGLSINGSAAMTLNNYRVRRV